MEITRQNKIHSSPYEQVQIRLQWCVIFTTSYLENNTYGGNIWYIITTFAQRE